MILMAKSKQARATEVDAYIFIKRKLAELGWNTRNPEAECRRTSMDSK